MLTELGALFLSFAKVSLFGFGGGQALIPLIKQEVVDIHHWLTLEEFINAMAIGDALPGPITIKLAVYIGMDVAGIPGAVMGVLGLCLPISLAMGLLFAFVRQFQESPHLRAILKGLRPAVIGILISVVIDLSPAGLTPFNWMAVLIVLGAVFMVQVLHLHPLVPIVTAMMVGLVYYTPWLELW